jgi:hypothetical protein
MKPAISDTDDSVSDQGYDQTTVDGPDISSSESIEFTPDEPGDPEAEPVGERTVAFFADPRAATILLTQTISELIAALSVKRGLVDLSSLPGLAVAAAFEEAGVPYESLVFGQENHYESLMPDRDSVHRPYIEADAERFRALAAGTHEMAVADFGTINANVVLIPAMVGPDEKLIDFSPTTTTGAVLEQFQALERALVLIDTPERGLRVMPDGSYQRTMVHVQGA